MDDDAHTERRSGIVSLSKTQAGVGLLSISGALGILILLCWHEIPQGNHDVIIAIAATIVANSSQVVGFFFGSSTGSQAKDAALARGATVTAPVPQSTINTQSIDSVQVDASKPTSPPT